MRRRPEPGFLDSCDVTASRCPPLSLQRSQIPAIDKERIEFRIMNALILVDLQNDFAEEGALAVPGAKDIIPLVNRIQQRFDLIVATQDWHPADHGSFAANHRGKSPGETVELGGLPQVLWPVHCVQGTHGADFIPGLDRAKWAAVFQKGIDKDIDSYSGFFDNGKKRTTGLDEYLKTCGADQVYVLGLATDYCVRATANDAVNLGFRTTFVEDASRGVDLNPGDVKNAIDQMRQAGVGIAKAAVIF
jgi:nicotinamidase/pyrazinamidase